MTKNVLYVYTGKNGVIWSPVLLPMEHTTMTQLVADDGKILKKGNEYYTIIDVQNDDVSNWTEVEFTEDIEKILEAE